MSTDLQTLRELSKFLTATTWIEFKDSVNDTEAFRRLVCGIRGMAPGPSPIDPSSLEGPRRESRAPQGAEAHDLSWAGLALASGVVVRFLFGTLQSPPSRQPELCHYAAALIEKYSYLLPPTIAANEQVYVAKARQTLTENGCLFATHAEGSVEPKNALNVLINATDDIPESFPVPHFWIGTSPPTQRAEETHFYSCDVSLALIRILLHCAGETGRTNELQEDLLCLPSHVRDDAQYLFYLLWPEAIAPSYSFMPLPKVQEASRAGLAILFPESRHTRETSEPVTHPVLVRAIEALRHRDFAVARELRRDLGARAESSPDSSIETALSYIDVSIAIADGDDASAERVLRDMFRRSTDSGVGL